MRFKFSQVWQYLAIVGFLLLFLALPLSKALASIAVGILVGTAIFNFPNRSRIQIPNYWWLPILLFLFLFVSVWYSNDYEEGWKVLYRQNTLIFLPFAFWVHSAICRSYFRRAMQVFLLSNTIAAICTLLFFFLPENQTIQLTNTFSFLQPYISHEKTHAFGTYSPFIDRLHFSYLLGTSILVNGCLLVEKRRSFLWISTLFIQVICFLILGGRGAQLAALASGLVGALLIYLQFIHPFLVPKISRLGSLGILFVGLTIGGLLLPYVAYKNVPAIAMRYDQLIWEISTLNDGTYVDFSYEHFTSLRRKVSWQTTWQSIQEQPILGVGIGDHNSILEAQYANGKFDIPINTHQQFLYYWMVAGAFAFIIFLAACLYFIILAIQQKIWLERLLLLCFITFYGIVFCLDSPLIYQTGGLAFWSFYLLLPIKGMDRFHEV